MDKLPGLAVIAVVIVPAVATIPACRLGRRNAFSPASHRHPGRGPEWPSLRTRWPRCGPRGDGCEAQSLHGVLGDARSALHLAAAVHAIVSWRE